MKTTLYRWTSCVMVLLLVVAPVLADANAAMLHATGSVSVNGKRVTRSTTAFAGDRIQTEAGSTVTLAEQGSTVLVPEKSAIVLRKNAIEVGAGRAIVATSQGMTVAVSDLTIAPASKAARFEIARSGGTARVTVLEGSVSVSDGTQVTLVAAGESLNSGEGLPSKPAQASSLAGHAIFLIVLAAVSTAVGVAIATTGEEPVSPAVFGQ